MAAVEHDNRAKVEGGIIGIIVRVLDGEVDKQGTAGAELNIFEFDTVGTRVIFEKIQDVEVVRRSLCRNFCKC